MPSLSRDAIVVRKYIPELDKNFIYSSWLTNYKKQSYFAKRIRHDVYFHGHQKIIDYLFSKPSIKVAIACPKEDLDTIVGYLVHEFMQDRPVIHFVFVKDIYRNMGIAKTLLQESGMEMDKLKFSHWTFPVDDLIQRYPDIIYDPYCL